MITKILKTIRRWWKIWSFPYKLHWKSPFTYCITPVQPREGGRTVGSGRVATIIE